MTPKAATVGRPYETCTLIVVGAVFRRRILFFPWRGYPFGAQAPLSASLTAGKSARPTNERAP